MVVHSGTEQSVLTAESVSKAYRTGWWPRRRTKHVLRGADLELLPGEVVGLVGENGSGKSTLMKMLVGALGRDAGTIRHSGLLGFCPQEPVLYERLTCDEHFELFGYAYGMTDNDMQTSRDALRPGSTGGCHGGVGGGPSVSLPVSTRREPRLKLEEWWYADDPSRRRWGKWALGAARVTAAVGGPPAGLVHRPSPLRMLWITGALAACFVGIQWGLRDAPVLWFAALRALVGGGALAVVALHQRRSLPRSVDVWGRISLLGLVNVSLAFATMFAGVAGLSTGIAAVLANAQPLLIVLPAWWLFRERVTPRVGVALVVGSGGLLMVAVPGGGGSGALLSLVSAAAVTAGTLMVRALGGVDVLVATAAHLVIGGLALAGVAFVVEGSPDIAWTPRFVLVLAFLGLVATAATTLAWFVEVQRAPLASLTVWMFLIPVFGLVIGIVLLGERPGGWTAAGVGLVLVSMWVALTKQGVLGAGPPGTLCVVCRPSATGGPGGPCDC